MGTSETDQKVALEQTSNETEVATTGEDGNKSAGYLVGAGVVGGVAASIMYLGEIAWERRISQPIDMVGGRSSALLLGATASKIPLVGNFAKTLNDRFMSSILTQKAIPNFPWKDALKMPDKFLDKISKGGILSLNHLDLLQNLHKDFTNEQGQLDFSVDNYFKAAGSLTEEVAETAVMNKIIDPLSNKLGLYKAEKAIANLAVKGSSVFGQNFASGVRKAFDYRVDLSKLDVPTAPEAGAPASATPPAPSAPPAGGVADDVTKTAAEALKEAKSLAHQTRELALKAKELAEKAKEAKNAISGVNVEIAKANLSNNNGVGKLILDKAKENVKEAEELAKNAKAAYQESAIKLAKEAKGSEKLLKASGAGNNAAKLSIVDDVVTKSEGAVAKTSRFSRVATGAKSLLSTGAKLLPAVAIAHEISSGTVLNNEELAREQSAVKATIQTASNGVVIGAAVTGTAITAGLAIGGASTLLAAGAVNIWNPVGWGLLAVGAGAAIYTAYTGESAGKGIADLAEKAGVVSFAESVWDGASNLFSSKKAPGSAPVVASAVVPATVSGAKALANNHSQDIVPFVPVTVTHEKYVVKPEVRKLQEEINESYRKKHPELKLAADFKIIDEDGKLGPLTAKAAVNQGFADKIGFGKLKEDPNFVAALEHKNDNYFKQLNNHKDFEKVIAKVSTHHKMNDISHHAPKIQISMKAESTDTARDHNHHFMVKGAVAADTNRTSVTGANQLADAINSSKPDRNNELARLIGVNNKPGRS
jgi:hypothetical protein